MDAGCTVVVSAGCCSVARAQAFDPGVTFDPRTARTDSFNRGENVSVEDRQRPEYDPKGERAGGFTVFPKVTASLTYDDNIFAATDHEVSDLIASVAPEIDVKSNWSRNALGGYVRADQSVYADHSGEDNTQYGLGASGKYEFGDARWGEAILDGGADFGRYTLPRTADITANQGDVTTHPIQYDQADLNAELTDTFNRLRLTGRADYQRLHYFDGETSAGAVVSEQINDRDALMLTGKAEYGLSPTTALFVSGAFDSQQYDRRPPVVPYDSNSRGFNISAGANFDITRLIRGEIQLGYLDQFYHQPFSDISGVAVKGQVEWFPTQLTTVTATLARAVGESLIIGAAGFLGATGGLRVDHELLRNLILSADLTATSDDYKGLSRTDDIYAAGLSATWLLTRRVGLRFGYARVDQRSTGAQRGPSFADDRISLSTTLQF
jgi:hypothetical protein